MTHSPACLSYQQDVTYARVAWQIRWPNHCATCEGVGGKSFAGYFDHRAGVGEPPNFEPCEACIGQGLCARCKAPLADQETCEGPCDSCGWNFDDQCPSGFEGDCNCNLPDFE